jgi:hypothetical protein
MQENPMDFGVICECGERLPVNERDADSKVTCRCGLKVVVPSLVELQERGVVVSAASVERRIRRMLAGGELPITGRCAGCGEEEAARVANAYVECEKSHTRTTGGFRFLVVPGLFWVAWNEEKRTEIIGRDTDVRTPFSVCPQCRRQLGKSRFWVYLLVAALLGVAGVLLLCLYPWVALVLFLLAFFLPEWLRVRAWERRQRTLRGLLRKVPVYGQLLDKYPFGVVVVPTVKI